MKSANIIVKEATDILESFAIGLQGLDKLWRCIEELFREHGTANLLQQQPPFRSFGASVRGPHKEHTKRGYPDRPEMFTLLVLHIVAGDDAALYNDPA